MLEDSVALLQHLVLLGARRDDHRPIRPVNFKEDRVLIAHLPLTRFRPRLILMVGVLLVHPIVQHTVWVRHFDLLSALESHFVGVRKALRQEAPDAVGVQLQRQPHLLAELASFTDQVRARVGNDAGHLHGVPAGALPHDITIEGVQDALVRKLQRVIKQHHVLRLHLLRQVPAFLRLLQILVPLFGLPFEHVATVAEISDRVHVEGVLPLADGVVLVLVDRTLHAPVGLLGELPHGLGDLGGLLLLHELAPLHAHGLARVPVFVVVAPLLVFHLVHDGLDVCPRGHVQFPTPLPVHIALALV
mmetsp:Transcript_47481/g.135520  ORF Transcript_47481/g.135520 Transcript_47481/m.135520 type:complete len:303 (+) Transcript_47481:2155-3063(+)